MRVDVIMFDVSKELKNVYKYTIDMSWNNCDDA